MSTLPLPFSRSTAAASKLDDAGWLRSRYLTVGDEAIARELGVHKRRVRAARERHGIPSHPVGPRRGVTPPSAAETKPHATRFPQLYDEFWWQQHRHQSNVAIGSVLGCSHETVRLARLEMGVEPIGRGRTRNVRPPDAQSPIDGLTNFERRLIDRYRADRRAAPTRELLSRRIVAAHEAHAAGDQLAYEGAMLDVATGAARIAEHEQKLRRAA